MNPVEPGGSIVIGVLGRLHVRDGADELTVSGARLRRLLVRLAVDAGDVVPAGDLLAAVWPESDGAPATAPNALQSLVSRLRKVLPGGGPVQQLPGGYRLAVDPAAVDICRFLSGAAAGHRQLVDGNAAAAAPVLRSALALWRGIPLPDADGAQYSLSVTAQLTQTRIAAVLDLAVAAAALGIEPEVVAELEGVLADEPLQEAVVGRLMSALVAAGRRADALTVYERLRTALAEELGVDPDPQLQQRHLDLLRADPPRTTENVAPQRFAGSIRYPLTTFLGRDQEVGRVRELMRDGRLVTVVGPGGAGKTRLSMEVARSWQAESLGPAWLVELAPVTADADIPQAVLGAIGLREAALMERRPERRSREPLERIREALQDTRALLVVDNCEHLLDGTAEVVADLLSWCPGLTVLATSREPLGVLGEALCALSSLGVPDADDDAQMAMRTPAVELLRQRAAAAGGGFQVTDGNVRDVAQIVLRLDGMPLAIELAAARVRVLPVAEIARRLDDRFRLLSGGNRAALPRHRSLHAVVEWSWDLLTDVERLLMERFSSFHGGAGEAAAVAVCADDRLPAADVPELLLALVDKSLLQPVPGNQLRYRMLETIREYGREQLSGRGEQQAADTAHARYFADLTLELEPVLRGRDQLSAFATLRAEQDNIAAALRHLGAVGDLDRVVSMALARIWFWTMTEDHLEVIAWTDFVLGLPGASAHHLAVFLQAGRAMALLASGALDVEPDGMRSVGEFRGIVDELMAAPPVPWPALQVLGPVLAFFSGDHDRGERWCEEMVQVDDPWLRATVRIMRANFAENKGDTAAMRADVDAALVDFESIGDRWGIATCLNSRAWLRSLESDVAGALADYERAQRQLREMQANEDDLMLLLRLAGLRVRIGDLDGARRDLALAASPGSGGPQSASRRMLADSILAVVEVTAGNAAAAADICRRLRNELDGQTGTEWMRGHIVAVVRSATAAVAVLMGDLDLARADLEIGYRPAAATEDLPILAGFGVSVAALAAELGRYDRAARILGAAARLRGGDDFTDPLIARTLRTVRQHRPDGEETAYRAARALLVADCTALLDPATLRLPAGEIATATATPASATAG